MQIPITQNKRPFYSRQFSVNQGLVQILTLPNYTLINGVNRVNKLICLKHLKENCQVKMLCKKSCRVTATIVGTVVVTLVTQPSCPLTRKSSRIIEFL